MTDTPGERPAGRKVLTPGQWIAIATMAVAVLGGVFIWTLDEHNARLSDNSARLGDVESATTNTADGVARVECSIKAINERLNDIAEGLGRIETNIDQLIQLHLNAGAAELLIEYIAGPVPIPPPADE